MDERCEYPGCGQPLKEGQPPPPSAQLCDAHDRELNEAVEEGDIAKMVAMAAKVDAGRLGISTDSDA